MRRSRRKEHTMRNEDLINYILSLTPEQIEKLIAQIPRLTELLAEQDQPCPPEQSVQNQ